MLLDLRSPGEGDQEFRQRAEQMASIARVLVDAALANHCIQGFIADSQLPMWTEACQRRSPTIRIEYVILRLKQYHLFAPQTVPLFLLSWLRAVLVLFDLTLFGSRPGLRFGTV